MALSLVAETFMKQQGQRHAPGKIGPRSSARSPSVKGIARGTMGVQGSRPYKERNSQAGFQKEYEQLNSPIFRAFMEQLAGHTPITDSLQGSR